MKSYFILIVIASFFFGCSNSEEVNSAKDRKLYNQRLELKKKFSAIKILEGIHRNAIDAFGNPVESGKWYALSNKTRVLFPIIWRHGSTLGSFKYWINRYPKDKIQIKRTRVIIICRNGSKNNAEVDMLLLGKNELFLYPEMISNERSPNGLIHANIR
jgi:hypothetical protein